MSVVVALRADKDSKIRELLEDPNLIDDYLWGDDSDTTEKRIDLEKAWHGIHYLLTNDPRGGEEPLCYLLAKGEEVGDNGVGLGVARALTSSQVSAFSEALDKIDETEFRNRFDPKAMSFHNIYPSIIWARADEEDDNLEYLCHYFDNLKTYVRNAKDEKNGLVIWRF